MQSATDRRSALSAEQSETDGLAGVVTPPGYRPVRYPGAQPTAKRRGSGMLDCFLFFLHQENGFHGEEILSDGEFLIELHCEQKIAIVFPFNLFGRGQVAVQKARAKCGTCTLFLKEVGLNIKTLENS